MVMNFVKCMLQLNQPIIVSLRRGGDDRAIFLCHSMLGNTNCYLALRESIPVEISIYGLNDPFTFGVAGRIATPNPDAALSDVIEIYVDAILQSGDWN
jgi:thioesterase domain-containing protein